MSDIAELGFKVDTAGLNDGSRALDQFKQKGKEAEDQAKRTGDAASKAGDGAKTLGAGVKDAGGAMDGWAKGAVAVNTALEQQIFKATATNAEWRVYQNLIKAGTTLETDAGKAIAARSLALEAQLSKQQAATVSTSALGQVLTALFPALTTTANASKIVAAEHAAAEGATHRFREALHAMRPVLDEAGVGMGRLGEYSRLAGAGMVAVAGVAAGAGLLALAKLGDEVERSRSRFQAMTGSVTGGNKALDAARDVAKSTGIELSTVTRAVQNMIEGEAKGTDGHVVYAKSLTGISKEAQSGISVIQTLGRVMQNAKEDADTETKALDALSGSIKKTGTLTAEAFNQIREASPAAARALAQAFGFGGTGSKPLDDFEAWLKRQPPNINNIEHALLRIKPAADAGFDAQPVKTFDQATRELTAEWRHFLETLAEGGAFDFVARELKGISDGVRTTIEEIRAAYNAFQSLKKAGSDYIEGLRNSSGAGVTQPSGSGNIPIIDPTFPTGSIGIPVPSGSSGSSGDNQINVTPNVNPFSSGPVFDIGENATGGTYMVSGSGGTDSVQLSGKVSPGETVSVTPAGGSSLSDQIAAQTETLSQRIDDSATSITDAIEKQSVGLAGQSAMISAALNSASARPTASASSASSPAASSDPMANAAAAIGQAIAAGDASPALLAAAEKLRAMGYTVGTGTTGSLGSQSAGPIGFTKAGGSIAGGFDDASGKAGQGSDVFDRGGSGGASSRGGTGVDRYPTIRSTPTLGPQKPGQTEVTTPSRQSDSDRAIEDIMKGISLPLDKEFKPLFGFGDDVKQVQKAIDDQTRESRQLGEETVKSIGESLTETKAGNAFDRDAAQRTDDTIRSGGDRSISATKEGDDRLVSATAQGDLQVGNALQSGFSAVVSALSSLAGSRGGSGGSGSGGSGGSPGSGASGGEDLTPGNRDPLDPGYPDFPDIPTIDLDKLDPSLLTDGGPVFDIGANAAGGSYMVPGIGRSDSILLTGRVSPGERIEVTPPGGAGRGGGITVNVNLSAMDMASILKNESELRAVLRRSVQAAMADY